ncbi:hypothetical protein pb186bvf_021068 [Paramecium bursaria]
MIGQFVLLSKQQNYIYIHSLLPPYSILEHINKFLSDLHSKLFYGLIAQQFNTSDFRIPVIERHLWIATISQLGLSLTTHGMQARYLEIMLLISIILNSFLIHSFLDNKRYHFGGLIQNTLRFWIGKSFLKNNSPNVALRILNEVVKFKKQLDLLNFEALKRLREQPIDDIARIHFGKEFSYLGFNGQISGFQMIFGGAGYVHDTDLLEAAIKSQFEIPQDKILVATKYLFYDGERVKAQNESPSLIEWPDQFQFALEYIIFGWFRYDAKNWLLQTTLQ